MMTILFISRWTFFLDCKSLVKTYKLLPHTHMGEPLLWECLPHPWTMRMASFKHVISSRLLILNLHFITSFFIMMMSWRNAFRAHSILCLQDILAIGSIITWPYSLNHQDILEIILWITYWSSLYHLHFLLISTLTPTYGSSVDYGQILQVNLNANISP